VRSALENICDQDGEALLEKPNPDEFLIEVINCFAIRGKSASAQLSKPQEI
jgi:hypothetical protein